MLVRGKAQAASSPTMFLGEDGEVDRQKSGVGYFVIGASGTVRGFWEAMQRFGQLEWSQVVEPALRLARGGYRRHLLTVPWTVLACLSVLFGILLLAVAARAQNLASDKEALEALYEATNGANWSNNTNWLSDRPLGDWHGVTTAADGRVTGLNLLSNRLTGVIPSQLGSLASLQYLWLSENQLMGGIPPELGSLASLRYLWLFENQLTGSIPSELGGLASLEDLRLFENQLTGSIPPELGSLASLQYLWLSENQLMGGIPPELGSLANLRELQLFRNQLTGSIPPELGSLANLQHLYLYYNQLTGNIPPELGSLANLQHLYLYYNQLTGSIPPELGSLASLRELVLFRNQLTGSIPPELGSLASLQDLWLSENQLTGSIPPELGNLASLQDLDLYYNQLTGSIPPELGNLAYLEWLSLSYNQLTGPIPPELGALTQLRGLYLSSNQLTGSIPSELGQLYQFLDPYAGLLSLILHNNQLTGSIPPELGSLVNLRNLWLSENQLTGTLPSELGNLVNLLGLRLSENQLTGTLTASLTNLRAMEELHFALNPGLCVQEDTAIRTWLSGIDEVLGPDCSPSVSLSVDHSRLVEGSGPTTVTVTATHTAVGSPTSVSLFIGGSAKPGVSQDYTLDKTLVADIIEDALAIPAHSASGTTTLTVTPLNDMLDENDENIIVQAYVGGKLSDLPGKVEGLVILTLSDAAVSESFSIPDRGGQSITSGGSADTLRVGYGRIRADAGSSTPAGIAIFQFRNSEGVLISEAGVPASEPVQEGRIFAEVNDPVNTGLAIANPNDVPATIQFYFTDTSGTRFADGRLELGAHQQTAKFLDQAPFNGGSSVLGTFTFTASVPVAVVALRGFTNEDGEFLMTTLPVAPLSPAATETVYIPHFAAGGGWVTQAILVNPTDSTITGTIGFLGPGSGTTAAPPVILTLDDGRTGSDFDYSIAPRSAQRFTTSNPSGGTSSGSVRAIPHSGNAAPSGLVVFSYATAGKTLSEAGVPALPNGSAFRVYAEAFGTRGQTGSISTGLAIANTADTSNTVTLELTNLDGSLAVAPATFALPPSGQVARFLDEFFSLPDNFSGVLRVTSTADVAIVALSLRVNENAEIKVTTLAPSNEMDPSTLADRFFPHLADSGGWSTQFILFSGTAGQASSGTLTFIDASGQPLDLTTQP